MNEIETANKLSEMGADFRNNHGVIVVNVQYVRNQPAPEKLLNFLKEQGFEFTGGTRGMREKYYKNFQQMTEEDMLNW